MTAYDINQNLKTRWRGALQWMITILLIAGGLLSTANWEADRQERVRMNFYRERITDLARISESIINGKLHEFDNSLLVLRDAYVADPERFAENVKMLQSGPLSDRDIIVVMVDHDGYLTYTDAADVPSRLYLGDRQYFRYFADGGKDRLYIDKPSLGRVTRRFSLPLARPIYDSHGMFIGVIVISVKQQSLVDFGLRLQLSGDTTITIVNQEGAVVSRSRDFVKFQGTTLPPELLAPMLKGTDGVFLNPSNPVGAQMVIAYRHIHDADTPLIVNVEASPANVLREISKQRSVLMWGAVFTSLVIMILIAVYLKSRRITAQMIDALQRSKEQEYETLTGTSLDGFYIADNSGRILDTNVTCRKLLGYTQEELLCLSISDLEATESPEQVAVHMRSAMETGGTRFHSRLRCKDETIIDVEISAQYNDESGGRFFVFIHDITKRKQADAALRKSEAHLQTLVQTIPDLIWLKDSDGVYLDCNEKFERFFGTKKKDIIGKTDYDFVDRELADFFREHDRKAMAAGVSCSNEEWLTFADDGHRVLVDTIKTPMLDAEGNILGVLGIAHDITDHKRIEEELRQSEERLALALKATQDAVWDWDLLTDALYYSPRWLDMLGYAENELDTGPDLWSQLMHPEDFRRASRIFSEALTADSSFEVEGRLRHKDGHDVPVLTRGFILRDDTGKPVRISGTNTDLSERKKIQEERMQWERRGLQLQKAESLSRMAGAIAHHFNNQLQVVMGNLEMAMDDLPSNSPTSAILNEAMKASSKASEISGLMMAYRGQTRGKLSPMDLSAACRQSMTLLQAAVPKDKIIEVDFPASGPIIRGNAGQINLVLNNLVSNAWESITSGPGTIGISARSVSQTDIPASYRVPIDWQPQDISYACIEVTDSGCGIPDKEIEKIFDPFFTTKFTGRGIGLSVVRGIAGAHGGGVTVESKPGQGSIFRVFLPVSTEEVPVLPEYAGQSPEIEEGGTILVVEDEEQVRNMVRIMLTRLGYGVLEAKEGNEAVEIFQKHQNVIRCVISDLTMPVMSGWDTLAALRRLSPDIPVILSSGYEEAQVMSGEYRERPQAFLGKPYRLQELKDTISQILSDQKKSRLHVDIIEQIDPK
jgi:two-component system, cell cycle sensor histidine kinase and response regulator CckA